MTKEKKIEEHCNLVDIIGYAMHDWGDYLDECYENGVSPVEDIEDFIADGVIHAGYRKQSEGEWKQEYNSYPRYCCTNCNHLFNNKSFKYCPNCGAKMKGGAYDG